MIPILGFKRIFRSFLRPAKGSLSAIIFLAVFRLKKPSKIVHVPSFGTICSSRWDCLFFRQRNCWVQMKSSWGSEKDLWQVQWLEQLHRQVYTHWRYLNQRDQGMKLLEIVVKINYENLSQNLSINDEKLSKKKPGA